MTMTEKEKVIERIRKLLALSTSANEHEAALAAERAQALLAQYNLSRSDVDRSEEQEFVMDYDEVTDSRPWRRGLATMVAQLYFCTYMFDWRKEPTTSRRCGYFRYDVHIFIGARHNMEVAKLMFKYLYETVERLAASGAKDIPLKERSSYETSFRTTCSARLCWRIREMIDNAKNGRAIVDGKNLPALIHLYDKAEMELGEFMEGKSKTVVPRGGLINHERGRNDGYKAGGEIGLNPQMDQTKVGHLLENKSRNGS